MEGIHSPSILADEGVTVSGNVENKVQRSVDFSTFLYVNHDKITYAICQINTTQRLTIYRDDFMSFLIFGRSFIIS